MIVISGALVLVALVLLVLGLTMQDLNFVYGSIAVSLVSFVFLVIGILQRRGEQPTPATAGPEVRDDSAPAAAPAVSQDPAPTAPVAAPAARTSLRRPATVVAPEPEQLDDEPFEGGGAVLVVPGRPRYHVEGCRYLSGKQAEQVDVLDARADGFTACGVCKPDLALVEEPADIFPVDEEPAGDVVDSGVPGTEDELEPAEEPVAAPVGTSRRGSRRVAEAAPARKAPAKRAAAKRAAAKAAAVAAPVDDAAAPAAAAPTKARRAGRVVVIPDRGRFHTADCRFVRGVAGTEELTKTQATKQGYQPCGVCKPA